MGFEPPKLRQIAAKVPSESPSWVQSQGGALSERITFADLQDRLERARLEYAARRYDSTASILQEIGQQIAEVASMPEPMPDRALLAASVACMTARLYREKDPRRSTDMFSECVRLFQRYESNIDEQKHPTRLYADYGIALYRTGDADNAIRILEKACAPGATPPEAFGYLGLAYQAQDKWEAAEAALRNGLQLAVEDPVLTRHLAVVLEKRGKPGEAAAMYADAALAHKRVNRLEDAAELAASALRLAPGDPEALVLAVEIERARSNREGAEAIVQRVLHEDPGHPWARGLEALLLREQGHIQEALDKLVTINVSAPELSWVLVERARTLLMIDTARQAEALELLDEASALDPIQPATLLLRGQIEIVAGETAAAVQSLTRAFELDPQSAVIACELGRAQASNGDLGQAHAAYDRAIEMDPTAVAALAGKASLYRAEGKFNDASLMVGRARQLEPDNAELVLFQADLLLDQNYPEAALSELESELRRTPDSVPLLAARGDLLQSFNRHAEAQVAFEAASRLNPDDPELQSRLADAARRAGDYETAGKAYDRTLELMPDSPPALATFAFYLGEVAEFGRALPFSQSAVEKAPDESWIWATHAWTLQHADRKHLEEAAQAYRMALESNPSEMEALWYRKGLGNVLCGLRRTEEAEAEFLKIVTALNERAYTQDPAATALLGWCHYRLRHYDEAIRLLQFSIGGEDPVTIQFDIALAILAGSGIDTYPRAIEVAERSPKLQQRGLFYIALFDLLEAIRGGHISASHSPVANRLWSKLKESGLSPSEFGWMAKEAAQAQ